MVFINQLKSKVVIYLVWYVLNWSIQTIVVSLSNKLAVSEWIVSENILDLFHLT